MPQLARCARRGDAARRDPTPATLFRALCRRRPPRPTGDPASLDGLAAQLRTLEPSGLAAWLGRLGDHPPEAVATRLGTCARALTLVAEPRRRCLMSQAVLAGLRWQGLHGARVVATHFDALDLEGRSLAAVLLGLLGIRAAVPRLLRLYARTRSDWRAGPLWGLVDLGAPEAVDLLIAELRERPRLAEILPMLALAGDERAVPALAADREGLWPALRRDHVFALMAIRARLGAQRFGASLGAAANDDAVDAVFERLSGGALVGHFGPLYEG